jgi:hypothetical protein
MEPPLLLRRQRHLRLRVAGCALGLDQRPVDRPIISEQEAHSRWTIDADKRGLRALSACDHGRELFHELGILDGRMDLFQDSSQSG